MIAFPNAKINIGLNIVEKRPDGFHDIETIFYPIGLSDVLEINKSEMISFQNSGLIVENRQFKSNLCFKAYELLKTDFQLAPVSMHLHKIIPFGAGIGGGSSDATFTLKLLNSLYKLNLDKDQLRKYAEKIGSDCSFFLINKPAFATGKGNNLHEISLNLNGYFLVLIHPQIHVSTAQAYANAVPQKPKTSLKELIAEPIKNWKDLIINDFEESVFKTHSELKYIKEELYKQGAIYASMSGSGSAIYGIFEKEINVKSKFKDYFIWTEQL